MHMYLKYAAISSEIYMYGIYIYIYIYIYIHFYESSYNSNRKKNINIQEVQMYKCINKFSLRVTRLFIQTGHSFLLINIGAIYFSI